MKYKNTLFAERANEILNRLSEECDCLFSIEFDSRLKAYDIYRDDMLLVSTIENDYALFSVCKALQEGYFIGWFAGMEEAQHIIGECNHEN